MAESALDPCNECDGTGWLWIEDSGVDGDTIDYIDDRWEPCDTCNEHAERVPEPPTEVTCD